MSRALMPKPFEPMLIVQEPSWDGSAEVNLEVNGHYVATTVLVPGMMDDWLAWINDWLRSELTRRC